MTHIDFIQKLELIRMLNKMIELITNDKLEELEPYCIALHGRVCHCRERQSLEKVE